MSQSRRSFLRTGAAAVATLPIIAATTARAQTTHTVTIKNFSFSPASISIAPGDTVTWVNEDRAGHSAWALDDSFDTGIIAPGSSASLTFSASGSFDYRCRPHGNMRATVVVG